MDHTSHEKAARLDQVASLVDRTRARFGGRLPEALERVLGIYAELAGEKLAAGESIDGILAAIDQSWANAKAMECGDTVPDFATDWVICE